MQCSESDVMCGLLHCDQSGDLALGLSSLASVSQPGPECSTALVDLGLGTSDPGLAPDGARCGPEHMCHERECVLVSSLMTECLCSGHGTCDNVGQCHCDPGWSGDQCTVSDHSIIKTLVISSSIIIILLTIIFFYRSRSHQMPPDDDINILVEHPYHDQWKHVNTDNIHVPRPFQL